MFLYFAGTIISGNPPLQCDPHAGIYGDLSNFLEFYTKTETFLAQDFTSLWLATHTLTCN